VGNRQPETRRPSLPRRRLLDAVSAVDAPFHGGGSFYLRVSAFGALAVLAFSVLGLRLWSLQVLQGPRYANVAAQQTFRTVELPAARGAIIDTNGHTLATTSGRLALEADPASLGSVENGRWVPSADGRRGLERIARLSHVKVAALVQRIRDSLVRSPYAPAEILPRLQRPLAFYLEERAESFPGFSVGQVPSRSYPQGSLGSEFLGLLGEISPEQLKQKRYAWAKPGLVIGTSGIERTYDRILNGGMTKERVRVDSMGRAVGRLTPLPSKPPDDLQLTIDARVQRAARNAIDNAIAGSRKLGYSPTGGAAVVLDAHTGAVIALVSRPGFNQVAAARNPGYLAHLLNCTGCLYNQATQGVFPSGSTFKPIVAEAAMQDGLITPTTPLPCTGSVTVGGHVFHNVEAWINETMTLPTAIAISCDTWFYQVGILQYRRLLQGDLALQKWARLLGFGAATRIDLPAESSGTVPTPKWVQRTQHLPWYEGTSITLAIGQSFLQVTPLQLAVAYAAFANGGTVVRPHLGKAILSSNGEVVKELRFKPVRHLHLVGLDAIRQGVIGAANSSGGTSAAIFSGFRPMVAGKTGTAEAPPGSDHSWYASWAPANDPKYVVVTLIEHGGFGSQAAAPAAKAIYQALFRAQKQRPGA
jgi:penicillin-binding protein 2